MFAGITRRLVAPSLALLLALGATACSNPVQEEAEEHAVGLRVLNAQGTEVARINIEATPVVTGQIVVVRGTPQTFTVTALSDEGEVISIDGVELGLTAAVAGAQATAAVQGAGQLLITGTQAGSTTITLALTHEGHEEFSRAVPLVVQ